MRPPTPRLTQRDPRVLCGRGAGVLAGGVALGGGFAGRVVAGGWGVLGGGAGSGGGSGGVALLGKATAFQFRLNALKFSLFVTTRETSGYCI